WQVEQVRDRQFAMRPGAELVAKPAGERRRMRGSLQRIAETVQNRRPVGDICEVDQPSSHQLSGSVSKNPLDGRALKSDDAVAVGERGDVRRVCHQRAQVLLTLQQGGCLFM